MRPIRTIAMFPTMLTLGNLVCGFFAIVVASRIVAVKDEHLLIDLTIIDPTNAMESGWLIFLAMVFDALDGYVARLSRTASDFGAQLDSLCDLVTFGVAPAFLLVKICPRFALFHHRGGVGDSRFVCGLCGAAAGAVQRRDGRRGRAPALQRAAQPGGGGRHRRLRHHVLHAAEGREPSALRRQIYVVLQTVLPFFAVAVALLMVSRIPYPHVVNQIFRGQRTFAHLVAVVFALVAVMVIRGYSIPIICCAFVFYGPVRLCWQKVVQRRQQEDSLF